MAATHQAGARDAAASQAEPAGDPLGSWREGATKQAIMDFVQRATTEGGADAVPPPERVAVFDNDGTLWCEKPMPIQLDFILRRLAVMADQDPALRTRQPWQAAYTRDYGWLGEVITKHYHGDDHELPVLAAGVLQAFGGISVEDLEAQADRFLRGTQHPTLGRTYLACGYRPMVELLATWTPTDFGTTSPRVVGATSCGRSARRSTASPPARHRQQRLADLEGGRGRRDDPSQARGRCLGRRSREAGADLESSRPAATAGGR
jgi:hypothetical protein